MKKKGFTLIELIVVMAIISILVLLGVPKYKEYTNQARITKLIVEAKELEKVSQKYYISNDDWPRLTDIPYTKEQVHSFTNKIYGSTGKVVELEENGNYYDIDYTKISNYITKPSSPEHYILQNPVGSVYFLDVITTIGINRTPSVKVNSITLDNDNITMYVNESQVLNVNISPSNATNKGVVWTSNNTDIATVDNLGLVKGIGVGTTTITATTQDRGLVANCVVTVESKVSGMLGRPMPTGTIATGSSVWNGYVAQNAADGRTDTFWRTDTTTGWIQFIFPNTEHISKIQLQTNEMTQNHIIYGLKDGVWLQIGSFTVNNPSSSGVYITSQYDVTEGNYEGLKINMTSVSKRWLTIGEVTIQ